MSSPVTTSRSPLTTTRRVASGSSSPPSTAGSTIGGTSTVRGGATARSAVPPRVAAGPLSTPARRASIRRAAGSSTPPLVTGDLEKASKESLAGALKRETEEKELLLLQIQAHEQTVASTSHENDNLTSALSTAESRLAELYAEQTRMEEDMAARLEIVEKLRVQVKELEKEKRDTLRRYNEQTATFEAERQAFYDSEQHLKSRITSLTQAMRRSRQSSPVVSTLDVPPESPRDENENESENDQLDNEKTPRIRKRQEVPSPVRAAADEATEPAEMTALKMELTTLSTSHASIQSTLHLLQAQLLELKRVNNELQEENESYNILLRERTLSGQFDILRATGGRNSDDEEDDEDEEGAVGAAEGTPAQRTFGDERPGRAMSVRSKSTLDVVPEHEEIVGSTSPAVPTTGLGLRDESPSSKQSKRARRAGARSGSPQLRGESLGDLPITGPGLDLAAELGRAESKDILEGRLDPAKAITQQQQAVAPKPEQTEEMQSLRSEVKSLRDANKALSLYASKIIDRIISQEGFEHVLAADYESPKTKGNSPKTTHPPKKASPLSSTVTSPPPPKARPKSLFFSSARSDEPPTSDAAPLMSRAATTSDATAGGGDPGAGAPAMAQTTSAPDTAAADKRARRGLSMDWKGLGFSSIFGGGGGSSQPATPATPPEVKNDKLRPLTLKANAPITGTGVVGSNGTNARKVETVEDENDRRERERMLATMKLMGIETPAPAPAPPPAEMFMRSPPPSLPSSPPASSSGGGRVAFFTRFRAAGGEASSSSVPHTPAATPPPGASSSLSQAPLTTEALEQAEAETTLAALDVREKAMAAEYAKGRSGSGFTEFGGRVSMGRKKSSSASGTGSKGGAGKARPSLDDHDEFGVGAGGSYSRPGSVNTIFSAGTVE